MVITKTPFRVSFFGGGTDYRPWFEKHGGLVISTAINKYARISVRRLKPFFEHKSRIVYSNIELVKSNSDIKHPSIQQCLKFMDITEGLEIHYDGDLPARSGIGSSSSFTVGFLKALHAVRQKMVTPRTLADEAIHVEQQMIKEDVGIQDQIIAAHGGMQIIQISPDGYSVTPLILPRDYLEEFEKHVMLGFTGINRFAVDFAKDQIISITKGKSTNQLSEILKLAEEALILFSRNEPIARIGELLDKSWIMKRTITSTISTGFIDQLYSKAKAAGAYGGKLLGAGGGGFLAFLAPPHLHNSIKKALSEVSVWVPFKIEKEGSKVLFFEDEET